MSCMLYMGCQVNLLPPFCACRSDTSKPEGTLKKANKKRPPKTFDQLLILATSLDVCRKPLRANDPF